MIYKKSVVKIADNIIKFISVMLLCFFCILISRHYYQVKNYATVLRGSLNVIIFFTENSPEGDMCTIERIKATNLVSIRKYVSASEAYLEAVKKNPFLEDILISSNTKSSIQAYAIATFRLISSEKLMSNTKKTLERISGVDEVVFDVPVFEQYMKTKNLLSLYKKVFFVFEVAGFILFILKFTLFIIMYKLNIKKLIVDIFLYLLCTIFAFFIFWIVCTYMHYPLLINNITILSIMPLVIALGVILS